MSDDEQNRLLAKAISDYNQAVKDWESCRARARELALGLRSASSRIEVALEGKRFVGREPLAEYPSKEDVDKLLSNIETIGGNAQRSCRIGEASRRSPGFVRG